MLIIIFLKFIGNSVDLSTVNILVLIPIYSSIQLVDILYSTCKFTPTNPRENIQLRMSMLAHFEKLQSN